MISRLFKGRNRLDSEDPAERIAAVDRLSATEELDRLVALVRTDPAPEVVRAALAKITDPKALSDLLAEPARTATVAARIADLLETGILSAWPDHPAVLIARLARNPSQQRIDEILAAEEPALLIEAILAVPADARDSILAHEKLHQATTLAELERRTRDKDKRLNRLARNRLEAIRRLRNDANALLERLEQRLEALEKRGDSSVIQSTADQREKALLAAVDADHGTLIEVAGQLAQAGEPLPQLVTFTQRIRTLERPSPAPIEESAARAQAAGPEPGRPDDPFQPLCEAFDELDRAFTEQTEFETLATQRQRLTEQWLAAADHQPPGAEQHEIFERVSHRFRELADAHERLADKPIDKPDLASLPDLNTTDLGPESAAAFEALDRDVERISRLLNRLDWPAWAARPAQLTALDQFLEQARDIGKVWQRKVADTERELARLLDELSTHVDDGELKPARAEAARLRNLLTRLPTSNAEPLQRQLGQISAKLNELSDWQTFATAPKRESLCAAMQALADEPRPPKEQASRIKQLRSEWNELGSASRAQDHRLLEQFNTAAEQAFEPCREYFADQAAQRANNLAAREAICATLGDYLASTDWARADYKAAEKIMRTARSEWRHHHPVDRTPGKAVETRFEKLQSELHARIKEEWDRNLGLKRQIVADAQALAAADDDVRERVESAKALQQRWKTIGVTPRRPDQVLWRDFRNACDRIFAARDEVRRSADESLRTTEAQLQAVVEELRGALDTDDGIDAATLRALQQRFDELPTLPERLQRPIARQFAELVKSARVALRAAKQAAERERRQALRHQDQELAQLEARHRQGETVEFSAADSLFEKRWALRDDPIPLTDLQRLTIETEIAAGLESPAADRERRLKIQVELMNTGRGQAALQDDPVALVAQWCRAGPKADQADELRVRFFDAIDTLAEH